MKSIYLLGGGALAIVLTLVLALGSGAQEENRVPQEAVPAVHKEAGIICLVDIKPGMKGYGLSVFSGTMIEKFDVEVVSVLRKSFGDKDAILVRVKHPVTDHANIIAGMSGSPIYFEGRLAGALSHYFTSFQKDPLAGVTPIEYMLADKDHPWEDENAFSPPLQDEGPFRLCKTPLFVSGLPPHAMKGLKAFAEPLGFTVQAGSSGHVNLAPEPKIEPGAAVGISILRGDINLDGIGTVTYVSGNDVLVFGHSMFMSGQMELPMTTGYVHTVIASEAGSFKLGSAVKPVGCILQDRLTSVYGTLGKTASMTPFTIEVENAQTHYRKTYQFEVARHPLYAPYLIAQIPSWCLGLAEAGEMKDQTVNYRLQLKFEGFPQIELGDTYLSSPMSSSGDGFGEVVMRLIGNPFRRVRLERVDVKLSVVHTRASAVIDGVWLQTRKVKPGEKLDMLVRLRPYNKEPITQNVEIPLPPTLPDGEYEVKVMGGRDASGMMDMQSILQALMSGRYSGLQQDAAQSFEELLEQIKRRHPADHIVAQLELPALGIRYKDRKLENLPGSVFVNLVSNSSAGMKIERDLLKVVHDTSWLIEGNKSVKFEIRTPGRVDQEEQK